MRSTAPLLAALLLALSLGACDSGTAPPPPPPDPQAGLFDASPLLPPPDDPGADDWHWVPDPEMRCRNGSSTGFGLRRVEGSRDLVIYLQGGGACYDFLSCANNPDAFGEGSFSSFAAGPGQRGVFAQASSANAFRDWNAVFVPYCTGDLHGGAAPDKLVPGLEVFGPQQFVGRQNVRCVLDRIRDAARGAERVVLLGESAGGIGTLLTYGLVADRLAPAPVELIDDSGPFPALNGAFPPARQQQWRTLWNLDGAFPAGCAACRQPDGLEHVLPYYATQHPDRQFGLISYRADLVIRLYYGYYGLIEPQVFESGLFGIRETVPDNVGTFYVPGDGHVFLTSGAYTNATVEGTTLAAWARDLVDGEVADVPASR